MMQRRRGVTLFELIVALFVLTTAMTAIVQLLAVAASQRRAVQQRRTAQTEVANQAERIALMPWSETAPGELANWNLPEVSHASLSQAAATIKVREEAEPVRSRRIRLRIQSPNAAGQMVDLADLTVWKYAPGGEP